jgi:hypothetical protein
MVPCPKCAGPMTRVRREGFMEDVVYLWAGRYPWICAICKSRVMIPLRRSRRQRDDSDVHP